MLYKVEVLNSWFPIGGFESALGFTENELTDSESEGTLEKMENGLLDDDEWDEDFIRQAEELAKAALASRPPPPLSYSPPRQLTQRSLQPTLTVDHLHHTSHLAKDQQINTLKVSYHIISLSLSLLPKLVLLLFTNI